MLRSHCTWGWALGSAAALAFSTSVLAGPFDDPFTGVVDIDVVQMNLTGNNGPQLGTWNATRNSSTPGTVTIDGTRTVTASQFKLSYNISASTALGPIGGTLNRTFELVGLLDPLGGPYSPPIYPLDPTDAVPPSDPVGALSGDSNYRTLEGAAPLGGSGVTVNAEKLVLNELIGRSPIPGGEQFVYNASLNLAAFHPAVSNFIVGMSGTVTINATPEPATLGLLALMLPFVRRRRVAA